MAAVRTDDGVRTAFAAATGWFLQVAPAAVGRWDELALGEWTVRDLVGHTSRSLLTVEAYLAEGERSPLAEDEPLTDGAAGYFGRTREIARTDPAAVAQRGRDAGAALGPDPLTVLRATADRVLALVDRTADDALARTAGGRMRLVDYLPTRTFELVVHTGDLAAALGVDAVPPPSAARAVLLLAGSLVAEQDALAVLFALTGRRPLPDGFSVV